MTEVAIELPAALQELAAGQQRLVVRAERVRDALAAAGERHQLLLPRILTRGGELRPYVNLFLDDEDIRALEGLETPLAGRRTLAVVPSVAGG